MTKNWVNDKGARFSALQLSKAAASLLSDIMTHANAPDMKELVGWEFAGINTAGVAHLLGFGKFKKVSTRVSPA
ncbi:MAG: hypothetical protein IPJ88_16155 [Myxococcales bacterium]|nr:MAG: hypothetical protein IPJ88_16155 [Myxococcales bacterium]